MQTKTTKEGKNSLIREIKPRLLYAISISPRNIGLILDQINKHNIDLVKLTKKLDKYVADPDKLANLDKKQIRRILYKKKVIEEVMGKFSSDELFDILSKIPQLIPKTTQDTAGNIGLQYKLLQEFVKCQDRALKQICITLHQFECYWKAIEDKQSAIKPLNCPLIVGGTGVGKTYIMEQAAHVFGFNLIKIDASRLTMEGYVGLHFSTQIMEALEKMKSSDNEFHKRTVVFVDEFDKLSSLYKLAESSDYKGDSLLNEMLPFLDHKAKTIQVVHEHRGGREQKGIDVSKICFVFGGAFTRLRDKKKISTIGFAQDTTRETNKLEIDELQSIYPKEIFGRIGRIIQLEDVTKDFLHTILDSPNYDSLKYYKSLFESHNEKLVLSDEDKDIILNKALDKETGARALGIALSEYLSDRIEHLLFN